MSCIVGLLGCFIFKFLGWCGFPYIYAPLTEQLVEWIRQSQARDRYFLLFCCVMHCMYLQQQQHHRHHHAFLINSNVIMETVCQNTTGVMVIMTV